jgi:hypothetical protein
MICGKTGIDDVIPPETFEEEQCFNVEFPS